MKFPDKDWLESICCIGQKKCCRYLVCGARGFECAKEQSDDGHLVKQIDDRVKKGMFNACGDNCDGPNATPRVLN